MLRVLHGPVNVGNQPWVLSRHERALGVQSDLVVSFGTWLQYPADRFLSVTPSLTWRALMKRVAFGMSAPFRYDVLHFYFGQSFMSGHSMPRFLGRFNDLKLARRLGRKVFMTLQGCDVRLSDRNSDRNPITMCHQGHCSLVESCRSSLDETRRRLIAEILPLCDRVFVLNPDLCNDAPDAVFMPYASVDIDAFKPVWPKTHGPITILHAPSDETIKGTRYIVAAIENLKKRWPIEFTQVKGLPYAEALNRYAGADLVIDQVLAGWYGGFAVEMMALGKPVAGYIRESDLAHVPESMRDEIAIRNISIHSLESDLETLLERRAEWPAWGQRARDYVMRWHHPHRIAEAMIRAYRDPESSFTLDCKHEEALACAA